MNNLQTAIQRPSHPPRHKHSRCTGAPTQKHQALRSSLRRRVSRCRSSNAEAQAQHLLLLGCQSKILKGLRSLCPTARLTLVTHDCVPSGKKARKASFPTGCHFCGEDLRRHAWCSDWKSCRQQKLWLFVKDRGHNTTLNAAKLHGTGPLSTRLSPRSLGNGHGTAKNTVAEAVLENRITYSQARRSCAC